MTSKINIGSNNKTDDDNDNNNNINQQQYDDSIDGDFKGKLLHLSCLWNNPELLSDLLLGDEAENINSQDSKGRTALHEAVISDSMECARLLLMNGADPNVRSYFQSESTTSSSSKSCLHLAVQRGNLDMVRLLIEFNADIFLRDNDGLTAIDLAQNENHENIVDELKAAIIEHETNLYKSLAIAVHKGDVKLMSELISDTSLKIDANNQFDRERIRSIMNYSLNGSNTLLFKACQEGHLEIVKKLIQAGADGRTHPTTKYSPLYIASYHGRLHICQILLEHFPELSAIYTVEHWLPIHAAAINNHQEIVQLLLGYPYPIKVMKPFLTNPAPTISSRQTTYSSNELSQTIGTNVSKSSKNSSNEDNCDSQYVYCMPFDLNAQDVAGQSVLYMATLAGNHSLVDYLLNLRLKAVIYDEMIMINSNDSSFDEDDFYEDCVSRNSTSGSSSPDITVISSLDSNKSSQRKDTQLSNEIKKISVDQLDKDKNSFRKLMGHLIDNSGLDKNKTTKDFGLKIYLINPIKIDMYCNHNRETSLHCAVQKRHYSIASLLLENGAYPNNPINGLTANTSSIVTRVSHFNHNLFNPRSSISESVKDLKIISNQLIGEDSNKSAENLAHNKERKFEPNECRNRSTALREAIRNRDRAMVDLLLRFGACDHIDSGRDCEQEECDSLSALEIAFSNHDYHFVSKLLSLKAYPDSEFKVNKKSFDIIGSNCMNALNRFHMINNFTVSSMFPTNPVMVDWHCLKINSLDDSFHHNLTQWLIDSALVYNVKLKLSHIQDSGSWNTALAAITRIDLSENGLISVPLILFTDLPSLKILNLSKNKLQTLPEIKTHSKEKAIDDESVSNIFRNNDESISPSQSSPKTSKTFLSRMRKSQSVTSALSTTSSNSMKQHNKYANKYNKTRSIDGSECLWNMPCLEELYLQDNQLECLPSSLFQQPELKILDLSNNKLRTLPPLFWFSPKLSELNLSLNLLCDLPSPVNCLNQITFDPPSRNSIVGTMSKSISTSSISSNLSISDLKLDVDSSGCSSPMITTAAAKISQTNLIPFELNIFKPWSGSVTVLSDSFHDQFDVVQNATNNKESLLSIDENKHHPYHFPSSRQESLNSSNLIKQHSSCSLIQLNLSHNGFDRIPFFLSCLATRLTHLNISYNRLKTVFDPNYILGHLPLSLRHLDLSHNQIDNWYNIDDDIDLDSESSDDLSNGETRTLCFHNFLRQQKSCFSPTLPSTSVDKFIGCPYKLHTKLDNLKTLILSNNHLKEIIVTREELIEWIDFEFVIQQQVQQKSKNIFTFNLSSSFGDSNRQSSNLSSSNFAARLFSNFGSQDDLHKSASMEDINLNYKASRYAKLFFPNLSMLDIANNHVSRVPKTISYYSQLSVLNLSGNTELSSLPPEMGLLAKLWNLNTRGCINLEEPIRSMINSKSYKTCDVISYLNSILENSKPYTRLKLMLVGYQNIGKTSLLEQLRHEGTARRSRAPPDHWGKRIGNKSMHMKTTRGSTLSTVGVDLCEWTYERKPLKGSNVRDRSLSRSRIVQVNNISNKNSLLSNNNIGPITFRTWDFGGQREYYATHQYFLSKRAIYLVVWKITDGEKGVIGMHNWLVNIQSRAPNSPVIIVGTHYDLVKEFYPPFYANELQNMIRDRYMSDAVDADKRGLPKVVASVEVSIKTRHNIRLLANIIYETASEMRSPGGKDRILEQKVPATYLALEEIVSILALERKSENLEPVLHAEQYRQEVARMMKERYDLAFRDYSELQQATRFLHENGVLLHYEDAHLKDLYFLDPQWLCDILAHVVTIREINPFVKNGIMKTEHLLQLFKNTHNAPMDVQSYLLSLLNKFELAITWDNRTLLIPSLLPTEEQLRAGYLGWDISIPLRSRLKIRNHLANDSGKNSTKFHFKNQLFFQEFTDSLDNQFKSNDDKLKTIPLCTVTATARHNQSIHRILILSYVPCGFWSRLIARVLADESVIDIVRSFYSLPPYAHNDPLLIDFLNNVKTFWHCWQTGFGLRYLDTFLLRVKEFSLINNTNIESKFALSSTWKNYCYPYDYNRIKFYLRQKKESIINDDKQTSKSSEWGEIDISSQSSSLIEIYLPNQALQVETCYYQEMKIENENRLIKNSYTLEPNMEMLTKLLVIIVEHIDTLLEDWYPSLGTRFIHTSDGRFLITRVVPCISCLQAFLNNKNETNNSDEAKDSNKNKEILSPDTSEIDSNLVDFYKLEVKKAALQATNVSDQQNSSIFSTIKANTDSSSHNASSELKSENKIRYHRVNAFMVEECILSVYEDTRLECFNHGRIRMDKIAPDFVFRDLKDNYRIESDQLKFGKLLGRGSFGFVFRAHYQPIQKIVQTKKENMIPSTVSNSTFYLQKNDQNSYNKNYEVALKLLQPIKIELCSKGIRKADVEAYTAMKSKWERDPLQYSCKAYCTARTELNILLNLKHSNIASIIGICPKPLALVLTLAPHGSLDIHTKAYRRSGARISAIILQKAFLQISKALEYLHQQHIIYRDLKSENVLVWSFPHPYANHPHSSYRIVNQSNHFGNDEVLLKLADYGISRSALPTGTKGFGGTEGFMAPEIMLFNGEEEYTEKVDCFSFAMFMYELSTLRFPFEGQEFAIRESILDGIRPAITQKDLEHLPESFIDLMTRAWAHEPSERPNMSQIVSIISAPEFCSLRDVATLSDNSALICATGFQKSDSFENNNRKKFGLFLSKIGKQIDFLEVDGSKWNPNGQRLVCENLNKRTITSSCIVNSNQLWLGDSTACINIYCFNDDSNYHQDNAFQLLCMVKLEFENPASVIAIKSICWIEKVELVIICSNNGEVWLLNFKNIMNKLETTIDLDVTLTSSSLGIKKIDNNNLPTFCVANVAIDSSNKTVNNNNNDTQTGIYFDIWCGQIEGQIVILTFKRSTLEIVRQTTIDHYIDRHFNQFNVPIAERNDVFLLVGTNNQPFVFSVLYSGYIIYQWDAQKKIITHKLDCSKLAPCSESLMSISIEDHLKPGNCRISEIAINEDNDEIYVGTNFGCIIVAELKSLKPITVFRPYQREVKFIITLNNYGNKIHHTMINSTNDDESHHEQRLDNNETNDNNKEIRNKDFSLSSIRNIWPFNKSTNNNVTSPTVDSKKTSMKPPLNNDNKLKNILPKKKNIKPFVTIGRGYRNLLDRFTCSSNHHESSPRNNDIYSDSNKNIKLKYASQFHAIIWDSGFWNFS